jgi:hypothetical protein
VYVYISTCIVGLSVDGVLPTQKKMDSNCCLPRRVKPDIALNQGLIADPCMYPKLTRVIRSHSHVIIILSWFGSIDQLVLVSNPLGLTKS